MEFRGRTAALDAAARAAMKNRKSRQAGLRAADPALVEAVTDFSDILRLAKEDEGFRRAAHDKARGIEMFTRPFPGLSPIHMMKARVVMPCNPREFLNFLEIDQRRQWDDHFISGFILDGESDRLQRILANQQGRRKAVGGGEGKSHTKGAGGKTSEEEEEEGGREEESASNTSSLTNRTAGSGEEGPTVRLKHMSFKSPVPLVVQKRDFEFIVGEQVFSNGTAVLKAFSPQEGRCKAVDSGNFIRGFMEISGFVAEPLPRGKGCQVTYVALVEPRGLVPPMVVNVLVGKQTATLATMQRTIYQAIKNGNSSEANSPKVVADGGENDKTIASSASERAAAATSRASSFLRSRLGRSHL